MYSAHSFRIFGWKPSGPADFVLFRSLSFFFTCSGVKHKEEIGASKFSSLTLGTLFVFSFVKTFSKKELKASAFSVLFSVILPSALRISPMSDLALVRER